MRSEPGQTLKVLQVIPAFYPARVYGGPIESVYQLCYHMTREACDVRVLTTDANGHNKVLGVEKNKEVEVIEGLRARYCPRLMPESVSYRLLRVLPQYIHWADIIHLTAVYSFPTIPTLFTSNLLGKPVIWSPRGAFRRWEGYTRIWIKALLEWVCRSVAPPSLALHVTSDEEARESLERFPTLKAFVVPNGVTIPNQVEHRNNKGILRLLYLGRLHPIKGIEHLLGACRLLKSESKMVWSLAIAGTGHPDYTESLRLKIEEMGLSKNVQMVGEVLGEAKKDIFENADVVVVPSHTESFGMVVAEAFSYGVPVIASKGTPWKKIEEIGCGLWVDNRDESLASAIKQMCQMPLQEMGQRGRDWMTKEFSWDSVAKQMVVLYESMVNKKRRMVKRPA